VPIDDFATTLWSLVLQAGRGDGAAEVGSRSRSTGKPVKNVTCANRSIIKIPMHGSNARGR
jgi:hypothetical protein